MSVPNLQLPWPKFTWENVRALICLAFQYQKVACKLALPNATWSIEALQLPVLLLRHHMSSLQHIFQHEDPPSDASERSSIWIMTHLTHKWIGWAHLTKAWTILMFPFQIFPLVLISISSQSTTACLLTNERTNRSTLKWTVDDSGIDSCNMVAIMMRPGIQCW